MVAQLNELGPCVNEFYPGLLLEMGKGNKRKVFRLHELTCETLDLIYIQFYTHKLSKHISFLQSEPKNAFSSELIELQSNYNWIRDICRVSLECGYAYEKLGSFFPLLHSHRGNIRIACHPNEFFCVYYRIHNHEFSHFS